MKREYKVETDKLFNISSLKKEIAKKNKTDKNYIYRLPTLEEFMEDYKELNLPLQGRGIPKAIFSSDSADEYTITLEKEGYYYYIIDNNDIKVYNITHHNQAYLAQKEYFSVALIKEKRKEAIIKIHVNISDHKYTNLNKEYDLSDISISDKAINIKNEIIIPKDAINLIILEKELEITIHINGQKIVINILEIDVKNTRNYIVLKEEDIRKIKKKINNIKSILIKETL